MIDPTEAELLACLCRNGSVSLHGRDGTPVEFSAGSVEGGRASGTASRAVVAPGMVLHGSFADPQLGAWLIDLRVVRVDYATPELAAVTVQLTAASPDNSRREAERVIAGGITWLVAIDCNEVDGGARVEGSLVDLSRAGVSFLTAWPLLPGDRLMFHGRFFADEVTAEVSVSSVRPAQLPGRRLVGCSFSDLPELERLRIERVLTMGTAAERPAVAAPARLRAIEGGRTGTDPDAPRWRLFRRP